MRHQSDHHPLFVFQEFSSVTHATPFKFFKSWTTHDDCKRLVKEIWIKPVVGTRMACLQQKLKRVKAAFILWKKSVFGDINL